MLLKALHASPARYASCSKPPASWSASSALLRASTPPRTPTANCSGRRWRAASSRRPASSALEAHRQRGSTHPTGRGSGRASGAAGSGDEDLWKGTRRGLPMSSMKPAGAPPVSIRAPTAQKSLHGRPPARRSPFTCSRRQPPRPADDPRADVRAAQSKAFSPRSDSASKAISSGRPASTSATAASHSACSSAEGSSTFARSASRSRGCGCMTGIPATAERARPHSSS